MNDVTYMNLALQLASATVGQTSPNPMVGSVVVNNGEIVGVGTHLKAGTGHAEVHALNMAGEKAKGGTIYVTLEPCSHFGKTPPCADLIIARGINRVVIATLDPNPLVAGRGVAKLRDANIEVVTGILKVEAEELNKVFFHYITKKLPYVTMKSATSLDGKIATSTGESKWITGVEAREDVHQLRHRHDAILVGIGTVLADNPSLTTRLETGGKNPIRIILDTRLQIQTNCKVVTDQLAETWIITTNQANVSKLQQLKELGVKVFRLEEDTIEISTMLQLLGKNGITSVFVEGGGMVNDSFLRSKLINEVITYIAPKIIGGKDAPSAFSGIGFQSLTEALNLKVKEVKQLGNDIKIVSIPKGE